MLDKPRILAGFTSIPHDNTYELRPEFGTQLLKYPTAELLRAPEQVAEPLCIQIGIVPGSFIL
jgi:hypothetical protein